MKKRNLAFILIISILGISTVGYGSYFIFGKPLESKIINVNPNEIAVTYKDFKTVGFKQISNKIESRDNLLLNDLLQIEMNFNDDFYNDLSNIDNSQTDRGALLFEMKVPSSNLYNHIKNIVTYDFIYFQYNDYYLDYFKNNHPQGPRYVSGNITEDCYSYYDGSNIINFLIPFADQHSELSDFYLYKIAEENSINSDVWTFKVIFDFNVLVGNSSLVSDISLSDFNNIELKISGVSLNA